MKAQLEELSDTRLRLNTKGNGKTKDLKKKIKDLANELKKKTRKKGTKSSNEAKYAWKNKNPGEKSNVNKDGWEDVLLVHQSQSGSRNVSTTQT